MSLFPISSLASLCIIYGAIQDLPDGSPGYERVVARVQGFSPERREQVEKANIRWLAPIARAIRMNRIDKPLLHSGGHVRDQGRGYLPVQRIEGLRT